MERTCRVKNYNKPKGYGIYWDKRYAMKEVECDWEFNPMHGMEECNRCGKCRSQPRNMEDLIESI